MQDGPALGEGTHAPEELDELDEPLEAELPPVPLLELTFALPPVLELLVDEVELPLGPVDPPAPDAPVPELLLLQAGSRRETTDARETATRPRGEKVAFMSRHDSNPAAIRERDLVQVVIKDSGHGLSDTARAHLFEAFFTTKASTQGTGLRLSISNNIVRALGAHSADSW